MRTAGLRRGGGHGPWRPKNPGLRPWLEIGEKVDNPDPRFILRSREDAQASHTQFLALRQVPPWTLPSAVSSNRFSECGASWNLKLGQHPDIPGLCRGQSGSPFVGLGV